MIGIERQRKIIKNQTDKFSVVDATSSNRVMAVGTNQGVNRGTKPMSTKLILKQISEMESEKDTQARYALKLHCGLVEKFQRPADEHTRNASQVRTAALDLVLTS